MRSCLLTGLRYPRFMCFYASTSMAKKRGYRTPTMEENILISEGVDGCTLSLNYSPTLEHPKKISTQEIVCDNSYSITEPHTTPHRNKYSEQVAYILFSLHQYSRCAPRKRRLAGSTDATTGKSPLATVAMPWVRLSLKSGGNF